MTLPPARDPRMDRDVAGGERSWTLVLVPHGARGRVREYTVSARQLQQLRWVARGLLVALVLLIAFLGVTLPRSLAYEGLLDENLALKGRLQEIDRRMAEVDRILLRLRLYDAQIRSLTTAGGDSGPIPPDELSIAPNVRGALAGRVDRDPHDDGFAMEDLDDVSTDEHVTLRPAEAWALGVQARTESFLALFSLAEPDLHHLMEELEDLHALEAALPSVWPSTGLLTSGFGYRRNPFGRVLRFHSGIDVANDRGTPIRAAASGRVVQAYENSGYGRMIEIDHGFGITTLYAHQSKLLVEEGDFVRAGQQIGTMGNTGRSTGPHLHFELRLDGHPVDPLEYLPR